MLLLLLFIFGVAFVLLGIFMLYKKKGILAVFFILLAILLVSVALIAMFLYPDRSLIHF